MRTVHEYCISANDLHFSTHTQHGVSVVFLRVKKIMSKTCDIEPLILYTDGGARGNPGPSAIGVVVSDARGIVVREISKHIGDATNNVAEYLAVIYGLQAALFLHAKKVVVNTDSQLVARQLKGEYRVKNKDLRKFFDIALNLCEGFDAVDIVEVPREKNRQADKLVNMALDRQGALQEGNGPFSSKQGR